MEGWNPMKDDYEDPEFNSYNRGPGRDMPRRGTSGRQNGVTLYVQGWPQEMTEEGLRNLFSNEGKVKSVTKKTSQKPDSGNTFGFVVVETVNDAERIIHKYNGFQVQRYTLKVKFSLSPEEKERRQKEKQENDEFIRSLNSQNGGSDSGAAAGTSRPSGAVSGDGSDRSVGTQRTGAASRRPSGAGDASDGGRTAQNASNRPLLPCTLCNKSANQKRCERCKAPYCSRDCQVNDWLKHKHTCQPIHSSAQGSRPSPSLSPALSHSPAPTSSPIHSPDPNRIIDELESQFEVTIDDSLVERIQQSSQEQSGGGRKRRVFMCDLPPPQLQPNTPTLMMTLSVQDPQEFHMFILKTEDQRNALQVQLDQYYMGTDNIGAHSYTPSTGEVCVAQYSADNSWYRACINRINLDSTFDLTFIDYGNSETRPGTKLRKLAPQFMDIPALAVRCSLPNICPIEGTVWKKEVIHVFHRLITVQPVVQATMVPTKKPTQTTTVSVSLPPDGKDLVEELVSLGVVRYKNDAARPTTNQPSMNRSQPNMNQARPTMTQAQPNMHEPRATPNQPRSAMNQSRATPNQPKPTMNQPRATNNQPKPNMNQSRATPNQSKPPINQTKLQSPPNRQTPSKQTTPQPQRTSTPIQASPQSRTTTTPTSEHQATREQSATIPPDAHVDVVIPPPSQPSVAKTLKKGVSYTVEVIQVDSPSQFWVCVQQPLLSELPALQDELNAHYNEMKPHNAFTPIGNKTYAAKFSDDVWYRGQVYDFDTNTASVVYLDYGNRMDVPFSWLHSLESRFLTLPYQAVKCCLNELGPKQEHWTKAAVSRFESLVREKVMRMEVVGGGVELLMVNLQDEAGHDVTDVLKGEGLAALRLPTASASTSNQQKMSTTTPPTQSVRMSRVMASELVPARVEVGQVAAVVVTDMKESDDFTVQVESEENARTMEAVKEILDSTRRGGHVPIKGELVAAKFTADNVWYRAVVISVHGEVVVVRFVDFGNSEEVDVSRIAKADERLLEHKCLGMRCKFSGSLSNPDVQVNSRVCLIVEAFDGEMHTVRMVDQENLPKSPQENGFEPRRDGSSPQTSNHHASGGADGGSNANQNSNPSRVIMASDLTKENFGARTSRVKVFVCTVISSKEFYVQRFKQQAALADLTAEMIVKYGAEPCGIRCYQPQIGEVVAAYSDTYNVWYRSEVRAFLKDKKVKVYHLDYAGFDILNPTHLRGPLPQEFSTLPIQAAHVMLGPSHLEFSERGELEFKNLVEFKNCGIVIEEVFPSYYLLEEITNLDNKTRVLEHLRERQLVHDLSGATEDAEATRESPVPSSRLPTSQKSPATANRQPTTTNQSSSKVVSPSVKPSVIKVSSIKKQDLPADGATVNIVHANSPSDFYINAANESVLEQINKLLVTMNEECSNDVHVYRPNCQDEVVAACYREIWYRASVLKMVTASKAKVYFLDLGNEDEIAVSNLRKLPTGMESLPQQAIHCGLAGVEGTESGGAWSPKAVEMFQKIVGMDWVLKPSGSSDSKEKYLVDLFNSELGVCLSDLLIGDDIAVKSEAQVPSSTQSENSSTSPSPSVSPSPSQPNGNVSYSGPRSMFSQLPALQMPTQVTVLVISMDSPGSFICMKATEVATITEIQTTILTHCTGSPPEGYQPHTGELCLAFSPEFGEWYRVRVEEGGTMLCVDYGCSLTVGPEHVHPCPPQLTTQPPIAFKCALSGLSPLGGSEWSQPAQDLMRELAEGHPVEMEVVSQDHDIYSVNLTSEGHSISQSLIDAGVAQKVTMGTEEDDDDIDPEIERLNRQLAELKMKKQQKLRR